MLFKKSFVLSKKNLCDNIPAEQFYGGVFMYKKILGLIFIICLIASTTFAQSKNVEIEGDHGKLVAILQTPDNQQKYPLVILCHGFNADKDYPLIKFLADDLEKIGIASIRFDFNGHGKSEGDFQDMTVPNEIVDAKKVYEYVSKLPGVTSISIAGHSQGGVVASMVAGELGAKKIKSVALMAASPSLRDDAIIGFMFRKKHYDLKNPPEYIEITTPYGSRRIGREYLLTLQKLPIYETSKKFTGPVLLIHGTADTHVAYTYSLHYQEVYKNSELKLLEGFNHAYEPDIEKAAEIVADFFKNKLK